MCLLLPKSNYTVYTPMYIRFFEHICGRFHPVLRLFRKSSIVFGQRHMLLPQETRRHSDGPPTGRHFGPQRRELAGAPQIYICLIRRLKGDHYQSFLLNCGSRRVWSICRRSLPGSVLLFYIISLLPPLFYRFAFSAFYFIETKWGF